MKLEQVAALVWRFAGIIVLLSLVPTLFQIAVVLFSDSGLVHGRSTPAFMQSARGFSTPIVLWLVFLAAVGVLCIYFSKALGALTARGLD